MPVKLPDMKPTEPFIPIRTSDRGTYKKCHRRWQFTSPLAMHLQPSIKYFGVVWPLQFGTLIHTALQEYYDPFLKRDPVEVFQTEFKLYEREVRANHPGYHEDYEADFVEHFELGVSMLDNYVDFAERHDDFEVIAVEHDFYVPLGFTAVDPRDGITKPVYYVGRMDMIKRSYKTGAYGLMDHKSSARIDEEFFLKLEMDEQCTSYLWAAEREAEIYDLPYKKINDIEYNVLRKVRIRPPTVLQSGGLSVDRQNESTTAELFDKEIQGRNLYEWFNSNLKAQGYLEWLREEGERRFFIREPVKRNDYEKVQLAMRVIQEAGEMLQTLNDAKEFPEAAQSILYPNPTGEWYCKSCPFRAPCLAMNDGSDWEGMLEENYEPSSYGVTDFDTITRFGG